MGRVRRREAPCHHLVDVGRGLGVAGVQQELRVRDRQILLQPPRLPRDRPDPRELLQQVIDSRIYNYVEWLMSKAAIESLDDGSAVVPSSAAAGRP